MCIFLYLPLSERERDKCVCVCGYKAHYSSHSFLAPFHLYTKRWRERLLTEIAQHNLSLHLSSANISQHQVMLAETIRGVLYRHFIVYRLKMHLLLSFSSFLMQRLVAKTYRSKMTRMDWHLQRFNFCFSQLIHNVIQKRKMLNILEVRTLGEMS